MKILDYEGLNTVWTDMHPHVCFYGTCDTASGIQAKTVTVNGLKDVLEGTRLLIRFENKNTHELPTLEVYSANLPSAKRFARPIVDEDGNMLSAISAGNLSGFCEFVLDSNGNWVLLSYKVGNRIIYTDDDTYPAGEPGMIWLKKK